MIGMVEERAVGDRQTWVIEHNDDSIRSLDTTDDVQGYSFRKRRMSHSQLEDEPHANPHGMILLLLVILAVGCFSVRKYPGLFSWLGSNADKVNRQYMYLAILQL
jgi:hypothetical protein